MSTTLIVVFRGSSVKSCLLWRNHQTHHDKNHQLCHIAAVCRLVTLDAEAPAPHQITVQLSSQVPGQVTALAVFRPTCAVCFKLCWLKCVLLLCTYSANTTWLDIADTLRTALLAPSWKSERVEITSGSIFLVFNCSFSN